MKENKFYFILNGYNCMITNSNYSNFFPLLLFLFSFKNQCYLYYFGKKFLIILDIIKKPSNLYMSTKKKNILVPDYTNSKREYILDEKSYILCYHLLRSLSFFRDISYVRVCMCHLK